LPLARQVTPPGFYSQITLADAGRFFIRRFRRLTQIFGRHVLPLRGKSRRRVFIRRLGQILADFFSREGVKVFFIRRFRRLTQIFFSRAVAKGTGFEWSGEKRNSLADKFG
jgi:hypothetical protein